ncbi:hypothetical protein BCN_3479 [Bacillus cereus NC7401]|nr:hypothetical protein BCN_3479 [Bacillus cereus NC7401]
MNLKRNCSIPVCSNRSYIYSSSRIICSRSTINCNATRYERCAGRRRVCNDNIISS